MFADKLYEKILEYKNPTVLGLDPRIEYVPKSIKAKYNNDGEAILEFNKLLIDELFNIIPAIKCQSAYYELLGPTGYTILQKTMAYAKKKGMIVILDAKRNDIGSTALAYAESYLANSFYDIDCLTVNGYLGTDGILPFVEMCKEHGKGIYILVKTSNPSSGELQDMTLENGKKVYEHMADLVSKWGKELIGKHGYSSIGAVIGATYPEQLQTLRKRMPTIPFLIPGYGAQGGKAFDVAKGFDNLGNGGLINSSRGLMCAWKKHKMDIEDFALAAKKEALEMKKELNKYINLEEK